MELLSVTLHLLGKKGRLIKPVYKCWFYCTTLNFDRDLAELSAYLKIRQWFCGRAHQNIVHAVIQHYFKPLQMKARPQNPWYNH